MTVCLYVWSKAKKADWISHLEQELDSLKTSEEKETRTGFGTEQTGTFGDTWCRFSPCRMSFVSGRMFFVSVMQPCWSQLWKNHTTFIDLPAVTNFLPPCMKRCHLQHASVGWDEIVVQLQLLSDNFTCIYFVEVLFNLSSLLFLSSWCSKGLRCDNLHKLGGTK